MTLDEIKAAVDAGRRVCWEHDGYPIVRDNLGQYLIVYRPNGNAVGLTAAYVGGCYVKEGRS